MIKRQKRDLVQWLFFCHVNSRPRSAFSTRLISHCICELKRWLEKMAILTTLFSIRHGQRLNFLVKSHSKMITSLTDYIFSGCAYATLDLKHIFNYMWDQTAGYLLFDLQILTLVSQVTHSLYHQQLIDSFIHSFDCSFVRSLVRSFANQSFVTITGGGGFFHSKGTWGCAA